MYSLPSTSRRREPSPLSTNSGYGVHHDQGARAVRLTPPGMSLHAASNNLALLAVLVPAMSWVLDMGNLGEIFLWLVIPAKAGIQGLFCSKQRHWIPAFAGMTE